MVSKLWFLVILNVFSFSVIVDGSCPIEGCSCDYENIICKNVMKPLNFTSFSGTIRTLVLEDSEIEETIFTLNSDTHQLTNLSLINCSIGGLVDSLKSMKGLKHLKFKSRVDLENVNLNYTSLQELDLSECSLEEQDLYHLSNILRQVPNVTRLTISGNKFRTIDASILAPLKHLKVLSAQDCGIETIKPYKLEAKLVEVDLSGNNLTELPPVIFESSTDSLENLSLERNPVQDITSSFSEFKSLKSLKLGGTNLHCSCKWITWMDFEKISPSDLKCHDLSIDKTLVLVKDYLRECGDTGSNSSLVIVIVFLVVVVVAAIVGCLVHRLLSNRRRMAQEKKAVRYSAVYRETVETSAPTSRTTMETKA